VLARKPSLKRSPGTRCAAINKLIDSMVMKLIINGTERNIDAPTVAALVEALAMKGDRLAIELNGEIVSRASWAGAALSDGDRLEIVHFVGGG